MSFLNLPICPAFGLMSRLIMFNTIAAIDDAIAAAGLRELDVLQAAGLCPRYLYRIRVAQKPLTGKTASRVQLAISELKSQRRMETREKATNGKRPWQSRSTADPLWLRTARLRRIALYIANQYLNVEQADLARAAGMSKANVSISMRQVEDDRQVDAEIETIIRAVEGALV